jgi:signal transduction histidine kinase
VVIITGYGTMEAAIRALKLGGQDFLLKAFTPDDLVTSVQKVLEKKRLIQENLRLKARLPILEISKALMSEINLERLARLALETVQQELKADRVSLMLLDEERQELSISAAFGLSDEVTTTTRVKMGQGLAGLAAQRREPILASEQTEDDPAIRASLAQSDVGSAICVPLLLRDRVLGVLNASRLLGGVLSSSKGGAPFRQDDVDLLSILGGQIAVAIENARLFEQAHQELAERKRAEEALQKSELRLRWLTQQIVTAQEEERHRLSRELHDEAGQALTALTINLDLIQADLPVEADPLRQRIAEAAALTEATMDRIRLLAQDLRPPALDAVGLIPTLEGFCQDFGARTQLHIDYANAELPTLPDAVNISLYRFLQEALTNVAKHANANQVQVALCYDGATVSLSVEDDGQGFDSDKRATMSDLDQPAGMGLLGMQERLDLLGGWLEIESQPGRGTHLVACVPWKEAT